MFVIELEDFIVNTRKGRVQDEQNVVSVLQRQMGKLGYDYPAKRARQAIVAGLKQIMDMSGTRPKWRWLALTSYARWPWIAVRETETQL